MISTLTRNGTGYAYSALRIFDAWGVVRYGAATGNPKGRYCASLGHKQDDESGLVYMRARYYEPTSGRFVSEDQAMDGSNWATYCENDPVNYSDRAGKSKASDYLGAYFLLDLVSLIGGSLCTAKFIDCLAQVAGASETLAWGGGVAIFVAVGWYSFASTLKGLTDTINSLSYIAAQMGAGDALLGFVNELKSGGPALASLGHSMEIYVWLGVIDSDE